MSLFFISIQHGNGTNIEYIASHRLGSLLEYKMKIIVLGALLFISLISCVSVDGKKVDEDFTWQALGERGLSVANTQISSSIDAKGISSNSLTNLLATEIRDERNDLKVKRLKKSDLDKKTLKYFRENNELDGPSIASLPVKGRNYIVMSSVIDDNISQHHDEKKNDKDKKTTYRYHTYRKMTVAFKIYDLEKKKVVWSGDVNKKITKTKSYDEKQHRKLIKSNNARDGINLVGGIAQAITGKEKVEDIVEKIDLYPKAASQRSTLKALFEDFADALPEKGMFE